MSDTALVIGGTRFIGRHLVEELLAHEYDVHIFNRGNHDNPFAADDRVSHVQGDRTDETDLRAAALAVEPAYVFDCVAYKPGELETALRLFSDVEAYVYISSGSAYGSEAIPKRENDTPLCPCSESQATDESAETYGPRKAEGDRLVARAAAGDLSGVEGTVNAVSLRPCIVYGPDDYTERLDYWIDRVRRFDRVVVPGDGQNLWHRAYVDDVASALRLVAERGEPGAAYNVGDRQLFTLSDTLELIAEAADTTVEVVTASDRELSAAGLTTDDFVLYRPSPHVLDTSRLAELGWESTPPAEAMAETVADHEASDRDGSEHDPGREAEESVIRVLETV